MSSAVARPKAASVICLKNASLPNAKVPEETTKSNWRGGGRQMMSRHSKLANCCRSAGSAGEEGLLRDVDEVGHDVVADVLARHEPRSWRKAMKSPQPQPTSTVPPRRPGPRLASSEPPRLPTPRAPVADLARLRPTSRPSRQRAGRRSGAAQVGQPRAAAAAAGASAPIPLGSQPGRPHAPPRLGAHALLSDWQGSVDTMAGSGQDQTPARSKRDGLACQRRVPVDEQFARPRSHSATHT